MTIRSLEVWSDTSSEAGMSSEGSERSSKGGKGGEAESLRGSQGGDERIIVEVQLEKREVGVRLPAIREVMGWVPDLPMQWKA